MRIRINHATNAAKAIATLAVYSALALSPIHAVAQAPTPPSQTWTGEITTGMCKATRGSMGHDCILNCVKAGEKYVLFTKGQVQEISNQDFSDLKEHAGHRVRLTGRLGSDGKTITVTKIEMPDRGR